MWTSQPRGASLVAQPSEPSPSRDVVCNDLSAGVQFVNAVHHLIEAVLVFHLAGNVLALGAFLVKLLVGDETCTRTDFNGLAVVQRDAGAGFHLGVDLGADLGGSANRVPWLFESNCPSHPCTSPMAGTP